MTLRQEQATIARMFHQPSAGLHQTVLQTRQRPVSEPVWQQQSSPEVAQVLGNDGQPHPHLVGSKPMATEPRHLHRLLAFFNLHFH
jgi:hypothetical protein